MLIEATTGVDVQVAVLGEIEVADGDESVALAPQLRRLLGLMVVADGGVVSSGRLAEYIADGNAGGSTVRTAVSRLRKVLGDRVESVDGGYRLIAGPDELDAARFEQLIERAKSADGEVAIAALTRSLELWRGRALGDLADEEWATGWAARLDGLRATAVEDIGEALVGADRGREAVDLLDEHVREHPYRERPVGLLMRALADDGRTADGLRVYERFRVTLRDDTGLEPSTELRQIEAELLAAGSHDGSGPPLPSGTVTFLFTDIVGSTERWAEDEAAMTEALAAHDGVLRHAVDAHDGVVFKHTGDGICAVFPSAANAVRAAATAQDQLGLPVRMGIHTGEAELRDRDYFGPTLNRVARIMDAGHGGQVLMSRAAAALVPDLETSDLGEHRLKGLASPERIFQVGTAEFPALRVATAHKGNLPEELTSFVGREEELGDIGDRLVEHRLVTLLGVGGTGKTRLATEAARALAPTFPDGCWLVELAQIQVPEAVPFVIATALGIRVPEQGDLIEVICRRLKHERLLLVVDNCEHLLEAAADSIEKIVAACPSVTVLATSREPLLVAGEQLIGLPSLTSEQAVELFVARATAERNDVDIDQHESVVVELCDRLDRLPLAIELAASRARTMSPAEILDRLDQRFRLLIGGRRSRMERHQTMRGTVDWSYELCGEAERWVFDAVSVFVGEFDSADAHAVAGGRDLDDLDVEDALAHLVDRSLVQRTSGPDGATRFSLLETMRAYGRERLRADGRADDVRDRHCAHVRTVLTDLGLRSLGPDEQAVRARLLTRTADALVALDRSIDAQQWDDAIRITFAFAGADHGLTSRMLIRTTDAALAVHGGYVGVEPAVAVALESLRSRIGRSFWAEPRDDRKQRIIAALDRPPTRFRDAVYPNPIVMLQGELDDEEIEVCEAWLEGLAGAPISVRARAEVDFVYALASCSRSRRALELRPRTQALLDELGSDYLRRMAEGVWALAHERLNELDEARALSERSVHTSGVPSLDFLTSASRHLRILARCGVRVTRADLRRPFDWLRDNSLDHLRIPPLISVAPALDVLGEFELAERAINAIPTDQADEFIADQAIHFSERLQEVVANRNGDADFGEFVADLFEFADRLDAQADD